MAGVTILSIAYGLDLESDEFKDYLQIAEKAAQIGSEITNAGTYLGTSSLLQYYSMHHS
jgi:hypothetical protein